jgi:aspartyl-tRNA(Asn)/glutamyl-tRNA(Gln) amidotransferase subunit B
MPDADLPPLFISSALVEHLRSTLPELPDITVERVQNTYGLSAKDAKTIVSQDDGDRLEYIEETIHLLSAKLGDSKQDQLKLGKNVGNWVLHELGGLQTSNEESWDSITISPTELADVIANVMHKQITARVAKQLLSTLNAMPAQASRPTVEQLIEDGNLRLRPLSTREYEALAKSIMDENPDMVSAVKDKGQKGKAMWFVGQMVRRGEEGTVEPEQARMVVERMLAV